MRTNDLLREKFRVQKLLDAEANEDLLQYVANAHARINDVESEYGVRFKYGKPNSDSGTEATPRSKK